MTPATITIGTTTVQVKNVPAAVMHYRLFQEDDWGSLDLALWEFERTALANGGTIHDRYTIRDCVVLVVWFHGIDVELNPLTGTRYE